jgi:hypothetical protein
MRRVSQHHNVKLHDLAEHLVQTGVLLDPGSALDGTGSASEDHPGLITEILNGERHPDGFAEGPASPSPQQ